MSGNDGCFTMASQFVGMRSCVSRRNDNVRQREEAYAEADEPEDRIRV